MDLKHGESKTRSIIDLTPVVRKQIETGGGGGVTTKSESLLNPHKSFLDLYHPLEPKVTGRVVASSIPLGSKN